MAARKKQKRKKGKGRAKEVPAEKSRRRQFGSVIERGASFVARWTDPDGKRRDKRFPTQCLAERHLSLKTEDFTRAAVLGIRPVESISFNKALDKYEEWFRNLKSKTVLMRELSFLRSKALPVFTGRALEAITRRDVERFLLLRAEEHKAGPATRNRTVGMLSKLFKRAIRLGHAVENPCAGIERSRESIREPVYLSLEEQDKVIDTCPPPFRWAVALLLDTGLRTGEALRLAWADFGAERGTLTVRVSKNGVPRVIPVTSRGRAALASLRTALPGGGGRADRIFRELTSLRKTGEPQFNGAAVKMWVVARKAAGFPTLRIHDLRHNFAATAARAGVPLSDLQRLLGHKTMAMTMRYAGHSPGNAADLARERLEAHFSEPRDKAVAQ